MDKTVRIEGRDENGQLFVQNFNETEGRQFLTKAVPFTIVQGAPNEKVHKVHRIEVPDVKLSF